MKQDRPTSFDIAFRAGVSQSTVSRALRDSPLVSPETREKVQAIAKELNYKVDKMASNLRTQATRTLALLLCEDPTSDDSMINPFFLSMLGSITRATATRGYDLLISFQQLSDDWHADYEDAHRADGIILLGYGDYVSTSDKLEKLDNAGAHYILWGPVVEGRLGHAIGCDNHKGGYLASQHLLQLGRRRIAYLGDASDHYPEFLERYLGHGQALSEFNVLNDPALQINAENTESSGFQACKQLMSSGARFDAILTASDMIAIGAIKALHESDYRVPQDVAVVGFDDIPSAGYIRPSLTTVLQDTTAAGELLVENLLKQINGEEIASKLLEPKLILRESCGHKHQ
jgi:DNA-binding LacI/PurR family transcriptional regulator